MLSNDRSTHTMETCQTVASIWVRRNFGVHPKAVQSHSPVQSVFRKPPPTAVDLTVRSTAFIKITTIITARQGCCPAMFFRLCSWDASTTPASPGVPFDFIIIINLLFLLSFAFDYYFFFFQFKKYLFSPVDDVASTQKDGLNGF